MCSTFCSVLLHVHCPYIYLYTVHVFLVHVHVYKFTMVLQNIYCPPTSLYCAHVVMNIHVFPVLQTGWIVQEWCINWNDDFEYFSAHVHIHSMSTDYVNTRMHVHHF